MSRCRQQCVVDTHRLAWVQIVQSQESDAAEMADQVQQLEGDREHLQVVTQDLDLAEDRVSQSSSRPSF